MHALAFLFMMDVVAALFALWVYALVSAITNERLDPTMRLVWVIVIIFVTGLGALLYLAIAPNRPTRAERAMAEWQRRNTDLRRRAVAPAGEPAAAGAVPPRL